MFNPKSDIITDLLKKTKNYMLCQNVFNEKCLIGDTPYSSYNNNIKLINYDVPGSSFNRNIIKRLKFLKENVSLFTHFFETTHKFYTVKSKSKDSNTIGHRCQN